jgi:hypothetical protein
LLEKKQIDVDMRKEDWCEREKELKQKLKKAEKLSESDLLRVY